MSHSRPLVALTSALLFLVGAVQAASIDTQQRRLSTTSGGETFIISGTLVTDDGSPIEGASVMVAEAKDAGYAIGIGDNGLPENPSVITDARGRFSITVRRSLFRSRREFILAVPLFAAMPRPISLHRDRATIKIDGGTAEYKLGKIRRNSRIVR
jgi:hypothetical protein